MSSDVIKNLIVKKLLENQSQILIKIWNLLIIDDIKHYINN